MEPDSKSKPQADSPAEAAGGAAPDVMEEFFKGLQSNMRRSDLSQEAITEAFQSIQRIALENDVEQTAGAGAPASLARGGGVCSTCGAENSAANRFCVSCGVPLLLAARHAPESGAAAGPLPPGQHHYHHHYHHHYFSGSGSPPVTATAAPTGIMPARTGTALRPLGGGGTLSRAEAAVRKVTLDWALACNTKHLDDLVGLYSADGFLLRPNVQPVRGTAAIREYFFAVLDAGLGEVEFEPLRVELFGDVAYEAGRCKMLVPTSTGKRREERGKYLMMFHRQDGEWKTIVDCWSSDLSLPIGVEQGATVAAAPHPMRPPRK